MLCWFEQAYQFECSAGCETSRGTTIFFAYVAAGTLIFISHKQAPTSGLEKQLGLWINI